MSMEGDLPMITEGGVGIIDGMVTVCRSPVVDKLTFSIAIKVCFVYRFRSIWN